MSEDQFTKLYKYMQGEFKTVNDKLDQKSDKKDVEHLVNVIDSYADKIDTFIMEMATMQHKLVV